MPGIRLITISGPRGAGKETLLSALCSAFPLRRVVPHTTRAPRPGEEDGREYHFVTNDRFQKMIEYEHLVWHTKIGGSQRSGTSKAEFRVVERSVIDITPLGARALKKKITLMGGAVLSLAVFADFAERQRRIMRRDPTITLDIASKLMRDDPASADRADYGGFDLLIDNNHADPAAACACAAEATAMFLRS